MEDMSSAPAGAAADAPTAEAPISKRAAKRAAKREERDAELQEKKKQRAAEVAERETARAAEKPQVWIEHAGAVHCMAWASESAGACCTINKCRKATVAYPTIKPPFDPHV